MHVRLERGRPTSWVHIFPREMTARPRDAELEEPLAKRSRTAAQQPRPPHPEASAKAQRLGRRGLIDRAEFVRLLQQSLAALGVGAVAEQLQRASGVACESQQASAWGGRQAGQWARAGGQAPT